jgi:hypothetical protein
MNKKPFKNVEFFGFLLALLLSIKEVPDVFNLLTFNVFKNIINDSFLTWAYIYIVRSIALKCLNYESPQNLSIEGINENITDNEKIWRLQVIILSFGWLFVKEWLLNKIGANAFYQTVKDPTYSTKFPFRDGIHYPRKHFEYYYQENYSNLFIKLRSWEQEENRGDSDYSIYEKQATTKEKIALLIISNFYWKWLIYRSFYKIINILKKEEIK